MDGPENESSIAVDNENRDENENTKKNSENLEKFSRQISTTEIEEHDEFIKSISNLVPCITVEPIAFFFIVVMYFQMSIMQQFIYYRVGKDVGLVNSTKAYVCDSTSNNSIEEQDLVNQIQDINANYGFFIALASSITTIICSPIYSLFSDKFGRRPMLIIPGIGLLIKSCLELCLIRFDWPIWVFIITEGLYGCFGGFSFALSVCYSYIADISSSRSRTKRMALLGIMVAIGALVTSLVCGVWIQKQGYLIPYAFTLGVSIGCLLYPIFILREPPKTFNRSEWAKMPTKTQLKSMMNIFKDKFGLEKKILILMLIMFNFYYVAEMSGFSLFGSYLMAYPICMDVVELSYFMFLNLGSLNLGTVVSLFVLTRFLSELSIVFVCLFSGLIFSIQMSFAATKHQVYIAAATNMLSFSAFPFIRGYLSKKMSPLQQGTLFGGLLILETISASITKVLVIYVYRNTFKIYLGMVYWFLSLFSITAVIMSLVIKWMDYKMNSDPKYDTIN